MKHLVRPKLLTVENEEEAPKFFGGTMPQYVAELRAAIDTAHRHDTKVTNGGITSLPTALITWQRLKHNKSQAAADDYARRTFGGSTPAAAGPGSCATCLPGPSRDLPTPTRRRP